MSGPSVLPVALILSTLAHTGMALAVCYSPFANADRSSRARLQPVELEFEITSAVKAETVRVPIEAPPIPIESTARKTKRRHIRNIRKRPDAVAERAPESAKRQNQPEESAADVARNAPLNIGALSDSVTAVLAESADAQQNANRTCAACASTNGSVRSNALVSDSTKARAAASRSQWNRIRSAIERYVEYPRLGRRFGWAGKVILRFKLMADGRVREARVDRSSGFALLDRSALEALERASPLPRPQTATEITIPILFALRP